MVKTASTHENSGKREVKYMPHIDKDKTIVEIVRKQIQTDCIRTVSAAYGD